jgi:hypothetical protein
VVADVAAAARVERHELVPKADVADGAFEVLDLELAPLAEG